MKVSLSADNPASDARLAYGVDPKRPERYSLRQARYDALAHDVNSLACKAASAGRRLSVLDIGSGGGTTPRYLRARPNYAAIDIDATDMDMQYCVDVSLYRNMFIGDFCEGYPDLPDASYDVVICEQVLEHVKDLETPMATIGRLVKPGGRAFVGVPIFLPPLALARRHLVPVFDKLVGRTKHRDHVQEFTLGKFQAMLVAQTGLQFIEARGFRIVSGGILRPLEEHRWWWAFNRKLGVALPAACIEAQVVLERPWS